MRLLNIAPSLFSLPTSTRSHDAHFPSLEHYLTLFESTSTAHSHYVWGASYTARLLCRPITRGMNTLSLLAPHASSRKFKVAPCVHALSHSYAPGDSRIRNQGQVPSRYWIFRSTSARDAHDVRTDVACLKSIHELSTPSSLSSNRCSEHVAFTTRHTRARD